MHLKTAKNDFFYNDFMFKIVKKKNVFLQSAVKKLRKVIWYNQKIINKI